MLPVSSTPVPLTPPAPKRDSPPVTVPVLAPATKQATTLKTAPVVIPPASRWFQRKKPILPPRIAVLTLKGVIAPAQKNTVDVFQALKALDPKKYPVLVLRIDSPGGDPALSEEIYEQLNTLRSRGVKILASVGSTAASGAYLIASAADRIYAPAMATTGSIGVIAPLKSSTGIRSKIGFQSRIFTAGKFKNMHDLDEIREESKDLPEGTLGPRAQLIQSRLDDIHTQFINMVMQGRHKATTLTKSSFSEDAIKAVADGRVLTGSQALQAGLIDEIGGLHKAIQKAQRLMPTTDSKVDYLAAPPLKKTLAQRLLGLLGFTEPVLSVQALGDGVQRLLKANGVEVATPAEHSAEPQLLAAEGGQAYLV